MAEYIPPPTPTTLGGVYARIAEAGYCVTGIDTNGHLVIQPFPMMKTSCCDGGSDTGGGTGGGASDAIDVTFDPTGLAHISALNVQAALEQLDAAIVAGNGGGGGTPSNQPTTIDVVSSKPTEAGTVNGQTAWDQSSGALYVWNGSAWIVAQAYYTPETPKGMALGPTLPVTGYEGQPFFNTADNKVYIWTSGSWATAQASITPDATQAIVIVASLPMLPNTAYPTGATVYSQREAALFTNVNGVWTDVTHTATPNAPDAVHWVTVLPALPNADYPINAAVFNGLDNKLYKNNGNVWQLIPQQATIAAGSITAGMIQAGAIGTDQLAANAVAARHIQANAVEAGKIAAAAVNTRELAAGSVTANILAANSVIAGKISAGAIGATEIQASSITGDRLAMNTITVGNANIANASITTLKVAGEAINVVRQVNRQDIQTPTVSSELMSISVYFPQDAVVNIQFSGNAFVSGAGAPLDNAFKYGAFWIRIDDVNQIGWWTTDPLVSSCMRSLTAGTHKFSCWAENPQNGIQYGNLSLVIHGAMR